ncbi:MAG: efflux transporter periplasmic adaptor subunit [Candidatus Schekmanbacteria bacterium GWA2_38_9]|uniref:Efflux transporter periplasmic adaptor subunit n=1 Tax=Candidatus Schekmanbacteria bacterium RIFCSPLOWO2_12_FULL_38_15 TaxID=1817883 RepID=A0A1F7SFD3_9BACT|nr:MAG: efflux transporter periplasmic adaptor subunit [Candidatus Schekmanbacteria bacterium GWA2_38_9]OGL48361.1 MAG: efflux transporter periplasmic adaptor subunit [Candidatus Schekmanbacteria bacterium RIFCSPLOWO2_02_FULL_38_14]OGL51887.1 MAG: efflux transporter periplasmic adaptor subunit [Candidatus Schekmanbacteria bacterium RIFCSPLOWO2_12_FULL_38_15]
MKKILIGVVIGIILVVALFFGFRKKENQAKYKLDKVLRGDIVATVNATGTVNPVSTILVGTQVSGKIKEIYADFNSFVKKSQLIALIDPVLFEAQVEQARANLMSAKANVEKAEASLLDAKRILERNTELFVKNLIISKSILDTSETNYEAGKSQLSAAKAQVAQAEASLSYAETNLKYTKILSPVDGIVVSRNVDIGQTVAASFQTPTLFTIARDLSEMQIDTNVDESDIGVIIVGQDVEFTVDAYPELTFKGTVFQVRNAPINIQNVITYDVVVKVDNSDLRLKPGMTANVSIITARKKDVLKIPNISLRFKPSENENKPSERKGSTVWTVENGKPKRIEVVTGISDGSYTELVSGNIKEGQEVITESISNGKNNSSSRMPRMF